MLFSLLFGLCAQENNAANITKRVEDLIVQFQSPDIKIKESAVKELAATGKESVTILLSKLNDANPKIRKISIDILGSLGQDANAAVPELVVRALRDQDQEVRQAACLTAVALFPKATVKFFDALENSKDQNIRIAALEAIVIVKAEEKSLVTAFIHAYTKDASPFVRNLSEKKLLGMGEKAIPYLKQGLQEKQTPEYKKACVEFLGKAKAIPAILDMVQCFLQEGNSSVANAIPVSIASMGKDALAVLNQLSQNPDWRIRKLVFESWEKMGKEANPSLSFVKQGLQDGNIYAREAAQKAYSKITGLTFSSEENLKKWIEDLQKGNLDTQLKAAASLAEMAEKASAAVPALAECIKRLPQRDSASRAVFFMALSKIGELAVPSLGELLKEEYPYETRRDATLTLTEMGTKAKGALPALVQALGQNLALSPTSTMNLRGRQFDAIDRITQGKPLPVLLQGLKHSDYRVRIGTARVIGSMEPKAIAAKSMLLEMAKDKNDAVKSAALSALKKIEEKN